MELEPGSFRDRNNQVYYESGEVFRDISSGALDHWRALANEPFFRTFTEKGCVIGTEIVAEHCGRWAATLRHDRVPFISYPYEWPFGMLRDAALLHLDILAEAIKSGWILKDATAYNVQWIGHRPVFIDTTSFEPYKLGTPWFAYRQFCMMFLYPLLMKAYRDIDFAPILRSNLDGIEPVEAAKYFSRFDAIKRGVLMHVFLHAKMQKRGERAELTGAKGAERTPQHSEAMILGTINSMRRLIQSLEVRGGQTAWSHYDQTHSYGDASFAEKATFVERNVSIRRHSMVWDLGCNTGTFSKICSPHADYVVAMDGDAVTIEKLYSRLHVREVANVLPLVMNLTNTSPAQGWMGRERKTVEERGKPDFVLCLALIHHMVISANIPLRSYIEWIRGLCGSAIIEFVGPEDEMTQKLLQNRVNQYADFNERNFLAIAGEMFTVRDSMALKGGRRTIYCLDPKA